MSLIDKTATQLAQLLQTGQVSARDVTEAFCDRIEAVEGKVNAFLDYDRGHALEQADTVDRRRAAGETLGSLAGIPVAVKDLMCAKGRPTTCASKVLESFVPPYNAHVIDRLCQQDAVLIGRTNMDEFAMGSSTENSAFKITGNPWDLTCIPGGSSGGSAAAVAASQTPVALGSDTGGSIRQPASHCGVVGVKPTYGRVSRYGLVAFASSLDQIGPMGHCVEDVARLLEVVAGHDPRDATCAQRDVPTYTRTLHQPIEGLRVGLVKEHFGQGLSPEVEKAIRAAVAVLQDRGAQVVDVSLPNSQYCVATYYLVATAEASSNLARYDGVHYGNRAEKFEDMIDMYRATRGQGFGAEVKRRIMLGTFALSAGYRDAYYIQALKIRRLIKNDFDEAFKSVDVICGPVTPLPAFKIGEKVDDPLAMYLTDIYTLSANLAGIAGMSVPCGFSSEGLPIGLQLQAPPFAEETMFRAAQMFESQTDWHQRRPEL